MINKAVHVPVLVDHVAMPAAFALPCDRSTDLVAPISWPNLFPKAAVCCAACCLCNTRLNEIRVLKIKLADLKRELHVLRTGVANVDVLKKEVSNGADSTLWHEVQGRWATTCAL